MREGSNLHPRTVTLSSHSRFFTRSFNTALISKSGLFCAKLSIWRSDVSVEVLDSEKVVFPSIIFARCTESLDQECEKSFIAGEQYRKNICDFFLFLKKQETFVRQK